MGRDASKIQKRDPSAQMQAADDNIDGSAPPNQSIASDGTRCSGIGTTPQAIPRTKERHSYAAVGPGSHSRNRTSLLYKLFTFGYAGCCTAHHSLLSGSLSAPQLDSCLLAERPVEPHSDRRSFRCLRQLAPRLSGISRITLAPAAIRAYRLMVHDKLSRVLGVPWYTIALPVWRHLLMLIIHPSSCNFVFRLSA